MSIFMTFRIAFRALARNKMRTALTMLGIAASVGGLFSVRSFNRGFNEGLAQELERTGTDHSQKIQEQRLQALGIRRPRGTRRWPFWRVCGTCCRSADPLW